MAPERPLLGAKWQRRKIHAIGEPKEGWPWNFLSGPAKHSTCNTAQGCAHPGELVNANWRAAAAAAAARQSTPSGGAAGGGALQSTAITADAWARGHAPATCACPSIQAPTRPLTQQPSHTFRRRLCAGHCCCCCFPASVKCRSTANWRAAAAAAVTVRL